MTPAYASRLSSFQSQPGEKINDPNYRRPLPRLNRASLSKPREHSIVCDDRIVHSPSQLSASFPSDLATDPDDGKMHMSRPTIICRDRPMNPRLQIPRLASSHQWAQSARTRRACDNCRKQKHKCSGHRPVCERCQKTGSGCIYGEGKKAKLAKSMKDLTDQVGVYRTLFREICPKLDPQSAQRAVEVLGETIDHQNYFLQRAPPPSDLISNNHSILPHPSTVYASLRALECTSEDFNRDPAIQAVGYIGEQSEVSWLYRLRRLLGVCDTNSPIGKQTSVASVAYFVDDTEFGVIDNIELSQRPPEEIASQLVHHYFKVVHPSFPILSKTIFSKQYQEFFSTSVNPGWRWLAILNLIFAISTRYLRYIRVSGVDAADSELGYFSRAWKLIMQSAFLTHANLQQVQVDGLLSFYLMTAGQINRSWTFCGISTHAAISMGLHLRSEGNAISDSSREIRYRVWWSLRSLGLSLCVMTGRPLNISNESYSTPLPVPLEEERLFRGPSAQPAMPKDAWLIGDWDKATECALTSELPEQPPPHPNNQYREAVEITSESARPSSSLYFCCLLDLNLILEETLNTLYAPSAGQKSRSWHQTEMHITALIAKADLWFSRLPDVFNFTQGAQALGMETASLAFRFYSTKILISQLCLRVVAEEPPQGKSPRTYSEEMSVTCINLAVDIINLLPSEPDFAWVSEISPWFHMLHYLVQSIAVLMFGLFLHQRSDDSEYDKLLKPTFKAILWLTDMAARDKASLKATSTCHELLSHLAARPRTQPPVMSENPHCDFSESSQ